MLRVLLVHELFAPDFRGGGEYIVLEAARELRRRNVDVRVLCSGDPAQGDFDGIPVRRLRRPRHLMNAAVLAVARAARDCDIVHGFTYNAAWAGILGARLARKPCVLGVLGLFGRAWLDMRGQVGGRLRMEGERALMTARVDRLTFLSEASRDQGIALGADPAVCRVVNPGIDPRCFDASGEKKDVVLFMGKVDVRKGIAEFLAAAAALPAAAFRVVGWGDDFARWAARAPANVEFAPYVLGANAAAAQFGEFERARIFVLPSFAETFGIAVAEAMAAGCAVVSSVALPFEGARVAAGDASGLTTAIRDLWANRELCARAGAVNRERARAFTWAAHGEALEAIYRELLAGPRRSVG